MIPFLNFRLGMISAEIVAGVQRASDEFIASVPETDVLAPCGCTISSRDGFCHQHDYTLVCWIDGCDLPFPHLPDGPQHVTSKDGCSCYYHNGDDFDICQIHMEELGLS